MRNNCSKILFMIMFKIVLKCIYTKLTLLIIMFCFYLKYFCCDIILFMFILVFAVEYILIIYSRRCVRDREMHYYINERRLPPREYKLLGCFYKMANINLRSPPTLKCVRPYNNV